MIKVLVAFLVSSSLISVRGEAKDWIPVRVKNPSGAKLYRGPQVESGILGTYPLNSKLKASDQQSGFYSIRFSKPWNGVDVIWIAGEDLEVFAVARSRSFSNTSLSTGDTAKKVLFSVGVGATFIEFQQTRVPEFSEWATTVKTALGFVLTDRWSLGGNVFYVHPVQSSAPDYKIQFLAGNLHLGYHFVVGSRSLWDFTLLGGWYYATTLAHSGDYGYRNLQGPKISPTVSRKLSEGRKVQAYLKFASVFSDYVFLPFQNLEIAGGCGFYLRPFKSGAVLGVTLDVATLRLDFSPISVQSNSYSLGMNYQF